MASDVVINGTTYPAVESIAVRDANGNVTQFYPDAVRYVEQTLTPAQQAQARNNMGAASQEEVNQLSSQIANILYEIPVRGIHYWTEADQEEIVQAVITALGTPVFGRMNNDKDIILTGNVKDGTYNLKWEYEDGTVVDICTLEHNSDDPSYTNLADPSSAEWLGAMRLNSSGAATACAGTCVTNFIPCKIGDIIRVKGLDISHYYTGYPNSLATGRVNAHFFAENKTTAIAKNVPADGNGWVYADDIWTYTVGTSLTAVSGSNSDIRYVRLTGILYDGCAVSDVIITVNEEIT